MSSPKQIIIVNSPNSLVGDVEVRLMIAACATLLQQVVTLWGICPPSEIVLWSDIASSKSQITADARRFFIIDEASGIQNALATHPEKDINLVGFVFTRAILANNGATIDGSNGKQTVSAALFQTIVESLINPLENLWWNDSISGEFISRRICDPVESTPVVITLTVTLPREQQSESNTSTSSTSSTTATAARDVATDETKINDISDTKKQIIADDDTPPVKADPQPQKKQDEPIKVNVHLCNFVLPSWCNPNAVDGSQLDFMNTLKHPFQVGIGGCCLKYESRDELIPRIVFDRHYPAWRRDLKRTQIVAQNVVLTSTLKK